ncbi:MAG: LamG domain-containing protein [Planctomycetota bacterium]|jgi:hypothetical protein
MRKSLIFAIVLFALFVCLSAPAGAGEIAIVNAGFEDPVLAEDDYTWLDVPGWTPIGAGPGIWHVTTSDFDPVVAPEGENVLYTENSPTGVPVGAAQVLTENFTAYTNYTLTVEVGNSWYYYYSGYSVQLLAGGVLIAEDYDTVWPPYYFWATSTVQYDFNPDDFDLVGQPLEIRLLNLGLDKDPDPTVGVEFDDVRLSSSFGGYYYKASNPDPEDGSRTPPDGDEGDGHWMLLQFTAGYGATTHTAYFSSNFDDVNDRNPAVSLGSPPYPGVPGYETAYYAGLNDPAVPEFARIPLERGVTYYWAVDESNATSTYPGDVWSFLIAPEKAWDPTPADDAQYIDGTSLALSWQLGSVPNPGDYSISYNVYWGTDQAAVEAGTSETANVSDPTHTIGPLSGDTDYYWKVDTVLLRVAPPFDTTIIPGDVWHFKTLISVPVVDEDLLGWWKLDGGIAPGMAFDSSGHANHGTLNGGPEFIAGRIDQALDLDGINDYVGTGKSLLSGLSQFTLAGWVSAGNPGAGRVGLFGQNDALEFGFQGGGLNCWTPDGGDVLAEWTHPNLTWHHVAAVGDGTNLIVYIDGVSAATGGTATGSYGSSAYGFNIGGGGVWDAGGNWFFGQIDDVRAYKRALSAREIKIIGGLTSASNPDPADGAIDVSRMPTLNWTPGVFVAAVNGNILYYGDDAASVANRTATSVTLTNPTYTLPLTLDLGRTFYWAVDTVNGVNAWPGDLWSFGVKDWLAVDDMESYTPWTMPGNNIFEAWRDGEGNCEPGNGNDTGSVLTENIDMVYVHGGLQSMNYYYDNDGLVYSPCTMTETPRPHKYSRIEAQIATLPSGIGNNWTVEGVKALSLRFYGYATNGVEPMWVQLSDGAKAVGNKVTYGDYEGEDAGAIAEEKWCEWFIDMADFGVNLSNAVSISIGIGTEGSTTAGGSGTIYFDDIRLYTPRCIAARQSPEMAKADFAPLGAPDCVVNHKEFEMMAEEWLVEVTSAPTSNLAGWWKLDDGTGTTAQDSSGRGNTGTLTNMDPASDWVEGLIGGALHFDGTDDYVDCGNNPSLQITGTAISISAWMKLDVPEDWSAIAMKTTTGDWADGYGLYAQASSVNFYVGSYNLDAAKSFVADNLWHHVVGTYDGSNVRIWVDGVEGSSFAYTGNISNADHSLELGRGADDAYNFAGTLDDIRVYNAALTEADIVSLSGLQTDLNDDMKINFKDFAEFGDKYLEEEMFP